MRPDNWHDLKEDEIVEFDVHCKMNKSWANEFLSMLKHMEEMGEYWVFWFSCILCGRGG